MLLVLLVVHFLFLPLPTRFFVFFLTSFLTFFLTLSPRLFPPSFSPLLSSASLSSSDVLTLTLQQHAPTSQSSDVYAFLSPLPLLRPQHASHSVCLQPSCCRRCGNRCSVVYSVPAGCFRKTAVPHPLASTTSCSWTHCCHHSSGGTTHSRWTAPPRPAQNAVFERR